jgi:hypothetical protein
MIFDAHEYTAIGNSGYVYNLSVCNHWYKADLSALVSGCIRSYGRNGIFERCPLKQRLNVGESGYEHYTIKLA